MSKRTDQHQRFLTEVSVAYRQGFLDRPIVDEYSLVLRSWLQALLPRWRPNKRSFQVQLTHDIDHLRRIGRPKKFLRNVSADVLKRRNPRLVLKRLSGVLDAKADPDWLGTDLLLAGAIEHGFESSFYLMTARPSTYDEGYDLRSSQLKPYVDKLKDLGVELGFHPGYHTFQNYQRLEEEKSRLDQVLGRSSYGGRQHYLRFKVPTTWRHWEQLGLAYDSSMGFADYPGFRCGTCYPFQPFDIEADRRLFVWERPLIVMERSLESYAVYSSQTELIQWTLRLAKHCKLVKGTFVLLWHNTLLEERWQNWGQMYLILLQALRGLN